MDRIETKRANTVLPNSKGREPRQSPVNSARPEPNSSVDVSISSLGASMDHQIVDRERVAEIRKAVEEGRYPVVPTRIADAMIAAGFLLRIGK